MSQFAKCHPVSCPCSVLLSITSTLRVIRNCIHHTPTVYHATQSRLCGTISWRGCVRHVPCVWYRWYRVLCLAARFRLVCDEMAIFRGDSNAVHHVLGTTIIFVLKYLGPDRQIFPDSGGRIFPKLTMRPVSVFPCECVVSRTSSNGFVFVVIARGARSTPYHVCVPVPNVCVRVWECVLQVSCRSGCTASRSVYFAGIRSRVVYL